jgi:hypothetical protein
MADNISPNLKKSIVMSSGDINGREEFNRQTDAPYYVKHKDTELLNNGKVIRKSLTREILLSIDTKYNNDMDSIQVLGWVDSGLIDPDFKDISVKGEALILVHWDVPIRTI